MNAIRRSLVCALSVSVMLAMAPAAGAISSDAGDAGPNFSESRRCGDGIPGTYRPHATNPGLLSSSFVVYGPWGDFYGRNRAQIAASQERWTVPGSGGGTLSVHERALPALAQVSANIAAAGGGYTVTNTSAWVFRTVGGRTALSNHAFGTAIDINPAQNPYREDNVLITNMPDWYVRAWTDAGFCWGGAWIDLKDSMHYSWMGPAATPNYGPRLSPYPPLTTAETGNWRGVLSQAAPFRDDGDEWSFTMADRSGDGADDLFAVGPGDGGMLTVLATGARSDFKVLGFRRPTAIVAGTEVLIGDFDHSSRADLWQVRPGAASITLDVYRDRDFFEEIGASFTVPRAGEASHEYALAHYDDDYDLDLMIIDRGATTRIEVWSGASGFTQRIVDTATQLGDTTDEDRWTFTVGDYDVDGAPDVYAVDRSGPAVLRIARGVDYAGPPVQVSTGIDARTVARFLIGDYDGDGRDDLYVLDRRRLKVYLGGVRPVGANLTFWFEPSNASPWDAGPECVGPGACDQIAFVGEKANWRLRDEVASESGYVEFVYGNPGDVPVMGDWDCDGDATPGLFRQADGFAYLRNANSKGNGDVRFFFGNPGDVPLAGDFNGDGCDTLSLYRPAEGRFYIINELGKDEQGLGKAEFAYLFGNVGDKPFVGDFDGNGVDDVGLHRESTGFMYYRLTHTQGNADDEFFFGDPGDLVLTGDWDGDGTDTVAVYRPEDSFWFIKLDNAAGVADHTIAFSGSRREDILPVAGPFGTSSRD